MSYRIGIDVGGTNTDAVVLDEEDVVLAKTKTPTTADVTTGIVDALGEVLDDVDGAAVAHVMLGTTHCTNAVIERQKLNDVGIIRVGAPATSAVQPLREWPGDLVAEIGGQWTLVEGGHEYDGTEINRLDEGAIREFLSANEAEIESVAVAAVFSPVRDDHEQRVAEIVADELGDVPVSLSSEIGSIGLLERENATILNAALTTVIGEAARSFREAMDQHGLDAQLYFGQNDGTLMDVDFAEKYPIYTVASGPANSIRGAAYLSEQTDGIIVDIGGTTTDVGALSDGFPRESATAVEIGEVRTNFRMPDIHSVGLGGGSIVHRDPVRIGPDSVGYELEEHALVFGGDTTTATDVAVATGRADIGTATPDLPTELLEASESYIKTQLERVIEAMKTGPKDVPVTIVGGGSILAPDELAGGAAVYRPEHYEVANAIGAGIAQVSGHVDRLFSLDEQDREAALREARETAVERAVEAGARPETVSVVDIEEVPLSYLPGNAIRIKVKAAGDLALGGDDE